MTEKFEQLKNRLGAKLARVKARLSATFDPLTLLAYLALGLILAMCGIYIDTFRYWLLMVVVLFIDIRSFRLGMRSSININVIDIDYDACTNTLSIQTKRNVNLNVNN